MYHRYISQTRLSRKGRYMKLSASEIESKQLSLDTIEQALTLIQVNGYVIFESVLPQPLIESLYTEHQIIFEKYLENPDPTFGVNHYRTYMPFRVPFADEQVVANPLVLPILKSLLGDDFVCHYLASNTCITGSNLQPPHSDVYPLFPNTDIKPPPYHMVVNIPLVDITEENGPIEFWAGGTHNSTFGMQEIEPLAPHMQSQMATMPAGSIFIRDGRMWHRGTHNKSDAPRPNLALVYTRPWVDVGARRIGIPQDSYDGLSDHARSIFRAENIGGELDEIV